MTDHGNDDADLWANTGRQPVNPPDPAADPTVAQPTFPSDPAPTTAQPAVPPTTVQPATPGSPGAGAAPGGYVTGPGTPPPAQPPVPPTGGNGGPGGPVGPTGPGSGAPAWLAPAAIGVLVAIVGAGLIYLITRDGGDDAVSTDVSSTVSIAPDTTLAADVTVPAETVPETTIVTETTIETETTIAAETTVAPTTAAPTTAAPTTAAPTTAAPEGIAPAQPGQALVAGQAFGIVSACNTSPVPGYGVRSYVVMGSAGPLVIEEGNDEGNAFGLFSDGGIPRDTDEYTELGDGFGMVVLEGDTSFDVAVNPAGVDVGDCTSRGSARLSDPASPEFGYTYGVVDVCGETAPFRAIAYLSEGGNVRIADNGDGTARVTLNTNDLFDATDPAATITSEGGRQVVTGEVNGSTIDGGTTQALRFEVDTSSVRACVGSESP